MPFGWESDVPGGPLKNRHLTSDIVTAAIAETVAFEHHVVNSSFGKRRGEMSSWVRASNIAPPTSLFVSEVERVPEYQQSVSLGQVRVRELAAAIPYSSLAEDLSVFDLRNTVQRSLQNMLTLWLDLLWATAARNCRLKYTPTGLATEALSTSGTFAATATVGINPYHLERMCDILYGLYHAPFYESNKYVLIANWLGMRSLQNDPKWDSWHVYKYPEARLNHELGSWDRAILVETNHNNAFRQVGTGAVLGEGYLFGYDPMRFAEAMSPELRLSAQDEDYGRKLGVGFVGILNMGLTWAGDSANAGEANVIHLGSL